MYCQKCGKENPEGAKFCMHCVADLSGYKVEVAPKIKVSPKISVSAKAEGGVALKWKQKPIRYAEIKGKGKLPVFERFIHGSGGSIDDVLVHPERFFCPHCGNYGPLEMEKGDCVFCRSEDKDTWYIHWIIRKVYEVLKQEDEWVWNPYYLFKCHACGKSSLLHPPWAGTVSSEFHICLLEYVYLDLKGTGKTPIYSWVRKYFGNNQYCSPTGPTCPMCGADGTRVIDSLFREKKREIASYLEPIIELIKYNLWKCPVCGIPFLTVVNRDLKESKSYEVHVYSLCDVCGTRKAEHTCYSCDKNICENCAVTGYIKRGLFSKETIKGCPNCAKKK